MVLRAKKQLVGKKMEKLSCQSSNVSIWDISAIMDNKEDTPYE
jgi:hypothetical protein